MQPELLHHNCPTVGESGPHSMAVHHWHGANATRQMICVHGLTRQGRDFDFLAEAATHKGYEVFCPDMPGRGQSDWLTHTLSYNVGTYVADMVHFMDARGIQQVDWVGTSMGGLIGMTLAAFFPQRIRKFVINDIGPFIPKEAMQRLKDYVGRQTAFSTREEAAKVLRATLAPWALEEERFWQHLITHSLITQPDGSVKLHYDAEIKQAFFAVEGDVDMWPLWEKIICPVLVLRGAESDLLTAETAQKMTETGPKAQLITYPGIGHAPGLMSQSQITDVLGWLGG